MSHFTKLVDDVLSTTDTLKTIAYSLFHQKDMDFTTCLSVYLTLIGHAVQDYTQHKGIRDDKKIAEALGKIVNILADVCGADIATVVNFDKEK